MNEETTNHLNEILAKIITSATQAEKLIIEQVPDVVEQLLLWKMTASLLFFVLPMAALVILLIWLKKNPISKAMKEDNAEKFILALLSMPASSLCIISILHNWDWLQIWLAPKIYLIEYATDLIK